MKIKDFSSQDYFVNSPFLLNALEIANNSWIPNYLKQDNGTVFIGLSPKA